MKTQVVIPDCKDCLSRECSLFQALSPEEISQITDNRGWNLYTRDQHIFFQGTRPSGLFCIHKGKIKIYKLDTMGHEQIVRLATDGDILGYRALISGENYASFAAPLEDSLICFIPRSIFLELLTTNKDLSMRMMMRLSMELKTAEQRLAEMAQKPVRERIAEALLILKERFGLQTDGKTLNVRMKREDFAHLVGTSTETAIRFLREFKNEGLIEINGRDVQILQSDRLIRTANVCE